ncbi:unnamed protein product [Echinostoma caproni]|uniref:Origin recognition complex subunit 1 n=1 Tax=Echinostoma caproni TaxID=27848 RepID=A0A183AGF8_9TREM|nr:unnamed protein product [Echinostoma caproni]
MKPPTSTPRRTMVTPKTASTNIDSPATPRAQRRPFGDTSDDHASDGDFNASSASSDDSDDSISTETSTTSSLASDLSSISDDDVYRPWAGKPRGLGRSRSTFIGTTPKRGFSKPERSTPSATPKRSIVPRRTVSVQPSVGRSVADSDRTIHGCLPERENEFDDIYTFIAGKLMDRTVMNKSLFILPHLHLALLTLIDSRCMYISGLPGTGKTASVNAVLAAMSDPAAGGNPTAFRKIVVNGMQVNDPQQVYVQILHKLTGKLTSAKHACQQLEREFCGTGGRTKSRPDDIQPVILVIDELDLLCTRRQDVLYNLFDWPSRSSRGRWPLIVLAIANTMDLPERLLHPRVASRLGMTRLTFAPYSHEQLVHIIRTRLAGTVRAVFQEKAIELASRKVAAVSGDVRRVLDICRRAAEIASSKTKSSDSVSVSMEHINAALREMFTTPKLTAIRACSVYEKLFLRALAAEFQARSAEEARLDRCIQQMCALCRLEGEWIPLTRVLKSPG